MRGKERRGYVASHLHAKKKRNFLFPLYFSPTLSTLQVLSSSAIGSRKKGPRLGCGRKRSLNYGFLSQMHIFYFILLKFQTIFFPLTPLHTSSRQDKTLPSQSHIKGEEHNKFGVDVRVKDRGKQIISFPIFQFLAILRASPCLVLKIMIRTCFYNDIVMLGQLQKLDGNWTKLDHQVIALTTVLQPD